MIPLDGLPENDEPFNLSEGDYFIDEESSLRAIPNGSVSNAVVEVDQEDIDNDRNDPDVVLDINIEGEEVAEDQNNESTPAKGNSRIRQRNPSQWK